MEDHFRFCFDCLQRRIESDFSEKIVFCHGISDSSLPFGSSAVVELSSSGSSGGGDGESSGSQSQFIVTYVPARQCRCLSDYVDEFIDGDSRPNVDHTNDGGTNSCSRNQVGGRSSSCDGEAASKPWENGSDCQPNNSTSKCSGLKGSDCQCCGHSHKYSFDRMINALAPLASAGFVCYSKFQDIASDYSSGSLEDHVLLSVCLLIEGKATGRDSLNFLNMIGMPGESVRPGCLRHPNIIPVIGILKSMEHINLVLPKVPCTLENILHFSPDAIKSEWDIKLLVYQILSALVYMHGLGFAHGNICPASIGMTKSFWPLISICEKPGLGLLNHKHTSPERTPGIVCCENDCACQGLYADLKLCLKIDWHTEFTKWWKGELSNFEYLLILNRLAGRRWGDHTFYPVMPWVIDFSSRPDESVQTGWRDLSKSKWRLAKGDEQLDFTYLTSEVPHHVSDECLSELAVCSYKARRLPLSILRLAVRSVYEPNEYPSTMQRLYQWTPDECIPEFYFDSQIFHSMHSGMADLAVPAWAGTAEEFVKIHRAALESDRVSSQIHNWIDITFGYKMSGDAAIAAKNVMLASSEPIVPRYSGRRQLFTQPHPVRRGSSSNPRYENKGTVMHQSSMTEVSHEEAILPEAANLQELEAASKFADHARYLSPVYFSYREDVSCLEELAHFGSEETGFNNLDIGRKSGIPFHVDTKFLLEHMEWEDAASMEYQELLLWRQKISPSETLSRAAAEDIFSVGCILAELLLRRPLFDPTSLPLYVDDGIIPDLVQELPPPARVIVEACIQKEWFRRPSAKCLLESPYFPSSVSSAYLFLAPLQLLAKDGSRLRYLASFVKQGALKAMGTFAAEKCALSCLPLVLTSTSDTEAEWACIVLKEFVKCLKPSAVKTQVLSCIQRVLQTTGYSHLKVSILQDSFVREIWNQVGKHVYLDTLHPLVLSNLHISPYKSSSAAAAVLLIGSSEELGIPITIHQTILPLIHCFGKGICPDGIDALVRIGGLLGDTFIVTQMIPLLKQVAYSCISISGMNRPEPVQSWSGLALVDCLVTLHGLVLMLPREVIVKEIFEGGRCLHVTILMQSTIEISVLQVAATSLLAVCQKLGPDLTAAHALPQIKELFDGLAFSQDTASRSGGSTGKSFKHSKSKSDRQTQMESRMDLVLLLYPSLASILGIEKLRQCCATWLLLEQFLLRCHNWKWEQTGESSPSSSEFFIAKRPIGNPVTSTDYRPAKMLLNGFGWSIPQAQAIRSVKKSPSRKLNKLEQSPADEPSAISNYTHLEQWSWFPSPVIGWDGPDFLSRLGGSKEELPWKIRASVVHSVRAHHGALRSLAVCGDESTVYTAGIGQGFKGTVQKWDLARMSSVSGYYGHEEVVNDICVLSTSGMMASCDGTIHVWNSRTGKLASVFSEACTNNVHFSGNSLIQSGNSNDQINMLNSSGILTGAFDGSLYTCMHHLEFNQKLVAGTGNGSLRFIDIAGGQKLHSWKGDSVESGFPSLVSAICSSASDERSIGSDSVSSSGWIAAGLSSGYCRLFDLRCGDAIASWQPHDGYITKLAAVEGHLLVSSSLDRTLRVWDLRRSPSAQLAVFRGHTDGVSGFSLWGQDVVSISRNKIGLSSLSKSTDEDGVHRITPQKLHIGNQGARNMSVLSSISILPFSRLFVVGTEDGYLRICC